VITVSLFLEPGEMAGGKSSSLLRVKMERDIVYGMVGRDISVLVKSSGSLNVI